jgi:O-antigen ligase
MAIVLLLISICSILFYGIAGEDKTWLLAPAYIASYGAITFSLLKQCIHFSMRARRPNHVLQASTEKLPVTTIFWVLFLVYGIAMISSAAVPFESKLVSLLVGGVVGAYLVWSSALTTFKDNRVILGVLVFVVMLCALYGLIVHFKCPERVLWGERWAVYDGRLMSTYICPNHFAHLMQMLLPFCLAFLFIPQSGLYLKVLSVYSFFVFLPTLFFTESRAGWLGSIVSVGVFVCFVALRRSRKLFGFLLVLVPLCSVLLLLGAWRYSETFQRRMQPVVAFLEGQATEGIGSEARDFRPQTWMDTIDMVRIRPVLGFGPGNYHYTYPEHRKRFKGDRIVTGHPHNEYLELVADYGLVGFGLFAIAWVYGCIWVFMKSLKAEEARHAYIGFAFLGAAAGTMVHSFFDFQMHVFPNALVFALLAAIATGPFLQARSTKYGKRRKISTTKEQSSKGTARVKNASSGSPEISPSGRPISNPPVMMAVVFSWMLGGGYLLATILCVQIMSSAFLRVLGDKAMNDAPVHGREMMLRASKLYRLAIKIDSQNWRALKGMGKMLYQQRYHCLDRAEKIALAREEWSWFEKAYGLNPKDPEIISSLGKNTLFLCRIQVKDSSESDKMFAIENGQIEQGIEWFREACRHRKFNHAYWWSLGVGLRKNGQYEEALEVFQYAATLKRTPSINANMKWLEKQLSGDVTAPLSHSLTGQVDRLHLRKEQMDLSALLDLMELKDK